ncbi:MAG TPA: hypothetical protein VLJ68_05905 [Chitinophagaceae bacterium]|nr:hypothetical protein [Chitinophagaceae bacterium]
MKKAVFVSLFAVFFIASALAQKPEEIMNRRSEKSPIEKIYLHLDRENYLAGEAIWFKAYLYSEYQPDTISTVAYVELLGQNSVVLSRNILPVFFGYAAGNISLPDTLSTGVYTLRSYTTTMFNQDPEFIYSRGIYIYGKKRVELPREKKTNLNFFPESGNFIAGALNTVAFKATDEYGLPLDLHGEIKNNRDQTVARLDAVHDGMGMFDLQTAAGESYYASIPGDGVVKNFPLPALVNTGIVFRVMPDPQGKYFELIQDKSNLAFRASYMIGQMQHHTVFRLDFNSSKDEITGIIKTNNLNSGIMQITVFNSENMPLAERLCFIDNKEYVLPAELTLDTLSFSTKAKNKFTVTLKDTLFGSFSVAITDNAYDLKPVREENILSRILLSSDLKGYVHNPSWYFSGNADSITTGLDLVMMTNGWRRFKWTELAKGIVAPSNYKDPGYISISGKLYIADTRRPHALKPILLFVASPDSSKTMLMTVTDAAGYFKVDSILFYERSRIWFKDIAGKKSMPLEVKLSADSLSRVWPMPAIEKQPSEAEKGGDKDLLSKMAFDLDAIQRAEGIMLKGVVVKTKKKNPVQELEEKYASGLFSGFSERTIDLVHNDEPKSGQNIFDYLNFRVPGLQVINDGGEYSIYFRQGPTPSAMGAIPMTLYLDEILTDASFISSIPADQVAMVKVFNSFAGAVGNGAGGVLAIYTKKGSDLYNSASVNDQASYLGFSVVKEFYSPQYDVDPAAMNKTDNRITLLWQPHIFKFGGSPDIPIRFFNNDRTKQFRVVVEGMTLDGKMLMLEKVIPAKKGF